MKFMEYVTSVHRTANTDMDLGKQAINASLSLVEEVGEVIGVWKKHVFHGHELDEAKLESEIGDCLFYSTWLWGLANGGGDYDSDALEQGICWNINKYAAKGFTAEGLANLARIASRIADEVVEGTLSRRLVVEAFRQLSPVAVFLQKSLAEIADSNNAKLLKRYPEGFSSKASIERVE